MLNVFLMMLAGASPVESRCHPGAEQAAVKLKAADQATARRDFRAANGALDEAIAALGRGYASPHVIDDTGLRLVLARSQQRKGKLKPAAELKRRVLTARLDLCRQPPPR